MPTMNRKRETDVYVLTRLDAVSWQILNKRYGPDDARHVVAHLSETSQAEVTVQWLRPTSLPTTYRTPIEALDSIHRSARQSSAATRPIPIAHVPPAASATRFGLARRDSVGQA